MNNIETISELLLLGEHQSQAQEMIIPLLSHRVITENAEKIIDAINSCGCMSFTLSKDELQKLILNEDKC